MSKTEIASDTKEYDFQPSLDVPVTLQLHWDFRDRMELIEQNTVSSEQECHEWVKDVQGRNPKPDGALCMVLLTESHSQFDRTTTLMPSLGLSDAESEVGNAD